MKACIPNLNSLSTAGEFKNQTPVLNFKEIKKKKTRLSVCSIDCTVTPVNWLARLAGDYVVVFLVSLLKGLDKSLCIPILNAVKVSDGENIWFVLFVFITL